MSLPLFYIAPLDLKEKHIILNEENSKHIVQVLRMQAGERLMLTDGQGNKHTAEITDPHKKKCAVNIF